MKFILICLGGALGTGCRYLITLATVNLLGPKFFWGTLVVNLIGSFLTCFIMEISAHSIFITSSTRLVLTVGFLGGLTTYSAFNFEVLAFLQQGDYTKGLGTFFLMSTLCLIFGILGFIAAQNIGS